MNFLSIKSRIKQQIFFVVLFVALIFSFKVSAENVNNDILVKSYSYPSINFYIDINKDSTVDVIEKETFKFNGEYHLGWRSLLLNKIDDITDIQVIDGNTNIPLNYTSSRLEKTNSNNWGYYTVFQQNGSKNIEWYFNEKDSIHSWILKYKLHGAIGFYKDHDELYYNLVTDFTVPIDRIDAIVILPEDIKIDELFSSYLSNSKGYFGKEKVDNRTFVFYANSIEPGGDFTIAPGWQKGMIDKNAYWLDFMSIYRNSIYSILLILLTGLGSLIYWYVREKRPMNKMTIITQFEPPENLPPAMAEIILKERISDKALPATIIDLAYRGYLTIKEEKYSIKEKIMNGNGFLIYLIVIPIFFFELKDLISKLSLSYVLLSGIIIVFMLIKLILSSSGSEYVLTKTDKDRGNLKEYEKKYLRVLFSSGESFSTFKEKNNTDRNHSQDMYKQIQEVRKILYNEMDINIKAYEVAPKWTNRASYLGIIWFIFIFVNTFLLNISGGFNQRYFIIISVIISSLIIYLTLTNPRLNTEGRALKAEWLGFKLYLNTAERYRLQNLTPEMFEKYLSYAMVFGIEKKWAKAFDDMNISAPSWYTGGVYNSSGVIAGSMASNFSASSFSSSFSSSFASSFSSAGGAGGGSGGGGGGGGGAS